MRRTESQNCRKMRCVEESSCMKKKVLLVCGSELCNAGVPNVIMTIVRGLQERYSFDILCFVANPGFFDDEFESYGGSIFRIDLPLYASNKFSYPLRWFKIKRELHTILSRTNYDIIHCHCGIDAGVCLYTAKRNHVPCRISHAHGTYIRKGKNILLRRYNSIQKSFIAINATTRLACSDIAGKTLFGGSHFENVLNPINIKEYEHISKIEHVGIHLLQIGYYCKNKNQMFSLRLLNCMKNMGIDCELHFIGFVTEEDYFKNMELYIHENELDDKVSFLPSDTDKRSAFAWADYTLVPSYSEGLSLVALESQCSETICLMSKHVPDDANIGYGIFLDSDDIDSWIETIIELQHNNEHRFDIRRDVSVEGYLECVKRAYEANK